MSPYYDTLQEDIFRAKATSSGPARIYGKDVYAALELLKSFVQVIEGANVFLASGENCKHRYAHIGYPMICAQCVTDLVGTTPVREKPDG
jgi:hypothetical protein